MTVQSAFIAWNACTHRIANPCKHPGTAHAEKGFPPHSAETRLMKRLIAFFLVTASLAALAACNTVAGAGEDLSSGGHAITNSAEKAK